MKQTAAIISTYAADISGICSAMYELGGMTVMHDASGCNSTYNTHDEPRWYDMDSLVFISGLSEMDALLGNDDKLVDDILSAAQDLHPRFITIGGTPIPMMMGTDFPAVARQIERETGIMTFGINTDGMHSYISGISKAFTMLAQRVCLEHIEKTSAISVNILGATPLDFSINGTIQAMEDILREHQIEVHGVWAMHTSSSKDLYQQIQTAGAAHVNLVISSCGLQAAKVLWERFQIPYVIGTPCGNGFTSKIIEAVLRAAKTGQHQNVCKNFPNGKTVIIGESITALSLANAIYDTTKKEVKVLCPVDIEEELLSDGCIKARDEAELIPYLKDAQIIIADPMYKPICPKKAKFVSLPHEGFSGRIYRHQIPRLVDGFDSFLEKAGMKK